MQVTVTACTWLWFVFSFLLHLDHNNSALNDLTFCRERKTSISFFPLQSDINRTAVLRKVPRLSPSWWSPPHLYFLVFELKACVSAEAALGADKRMFLSPINIWLLPFLSDTKPCVSHPTADVLAGLLSRDAHGCEFSVTCLLVEELRESWWQMPHWRQQSFAA